MLRWEASILFSNSETETDSEADSETNSKTETESNAMLDKRTDGWISGGRKNALWKDRRTAERK